MAKMPGRVRKTGLVEDPRFTVLDMRMIVR